MPLENVSKHANPCHMCRLQWFFLTNLKRAKTCQILTPAVYRGSKRAKTCQNVPAAPPHSSLAMGGTEGAKGELAEKGYTEKGVKGAVKGGKKGKTGEKGKGGYVKNIVVEKGGKGVGPPRARDAPPTDGGIQKGAYVTYDEGEPETYSMEKGAYKGKGKKPPAEDACAAGPDPREKGVVEEPDVVETSASVGKGKKGKKGGKSDATKGKKGSVVKEPDAADVEKGASMGKGKKGGKSDAVEMGKGKKGKKAGKSDAVEMGKGKKGGERDAVEMGKGENGGESDAAEMGKGKKGKKGGESDAVESDAAEMGKGKKGKKGKTGKKGGESDPAEKKEDMVKEPDAADLEKGAWMGKGKKGKSDAVEMGKGKGKKGDLVEESKGAYMGKGKTKGKKGELESLDTLRGSQMRQTGQSTWLPARARACTLPPMPRP